MAGSCLVISPFLPRRTDAGHRKRTHEACLLLRDLGHEITFVHLAFEGAWFWRRQSVDHAELAGCGIRSYHEVYVDDRVGRAPGEGRELHHLDEWWHPALEAFLVNHLRRHHYELAVVHNVWLSKAFDFLPRHTVRAIETHDIFSIRGAQFARIGAKQDFFACSEADEVFGLKRAQIAIAIKEEDRAWFSKKAGVEAVTVSPRPGEAAAPREGYRHPEKVSFGFMGSAHAFNLHCLAQFLGELKHRLRMNPVALEFVVAGTAGGAIELAEHPYVRALGFVEQVEDFYAAVDFVVSPLDFGTGVKIKVAEAIELGVPILATAHSAEGTGLDRAMIEPDKSALAERVIGIARDRPPFAGFSRRAAASRSAAVSAYAQSRAQLQRRLLQHRRRVVLDLPELLLPAAHPLRAIAVCTLRMYAGQGSVFVLAERHLAGRYEAALATMPPSVQLTVLRFDLAQAAADAASGEVFVDVIDESLAGLFEGAALHSSRRMLRSLHARTEALDERLALGDEPVPRGGLLRVRTQRGRPSDARLVLPLFSDAVYWDPGLAPPALRESGPATTFVRLPQASQAALARYVQCHHPGHELIAYADDDALSAALPALLRSGRIGKEVHLPAAHTRLELALIEFLKCFGCHVQAGLGFAARRTRAAPAATQLPSVQQIETHTTRVAVEFLCAQT